MRGEHLFLIIYFMRNKMASPESVEDGDVAKGVTYATAGAGREELSITPLVRTMLASKAPSSKPSPNPGAGLGFYLSNTSRTLRDNAAGRKGFWMKEMLGPCSSFQPKFTFV